MSRDFELDGRDFEEREASEPESRVRLSQGRGGGSGNDENPRLKPADAILAVVRGLIDDATEDHPTVPEFMDRLERRGVHAVASVQSSGRWNGIVYEYAGARIKGSHLGRAYTAKGLQQRRGLRYDPARDDDRLAQTVSHAPPFRPPESVPRDLDQPARDLPSRVRDSTGLSPAHRAVLWDVGRFRTVAVTDLERTRYGGRSRLLQRDLNELIKGGLLERRTVHVNGRGKTLTVVALTRRGQNAVKRSAHGTDASQAIYSGFVKPREIVHDAALYRMFQAEAARIEKDGGTVRSVVLDYELKKRAYSPLAKARDLPPAEFADRQRSVAQENDLPLVDGRLVLPDLRIEYQSRDGQEQHVDLELATRNYRSQHLRAKAAAGFRMYADASSGALASALDDHDLIAEILR